MIDTKTVPKRRLNAMYSFVYDRHMIVRRNRIYELSGPAIHIWGLIDGCRSVSDIAEQVAKLYSMDISVVLDDCVDTFTYFSASGLIDLLGWAAQSPQETR